MLRFPFRVERSRTLGVITYPVLPIEGFSNRLSRWIRLGGVLADTGADFSLFPASFADVLLPEGWEGRQTHVMGIVPLQSLRVSLHSIRLRVGPRCFKALVGLADSNAIPAVLGRYQALDRFTAVFKQGRSLVLQW